MKLSHKDVWNFQYRGIFAEIVHWGIADYQLKGIWNLYIYINPENIGDKELKKNFLPIFKKVTWGGKENQIYDIYSCQIANELELHGGATYLNIENSNGKKILKIGCDYNHLYDNETDWNENILAFHGKQSIDKLHDFTKILVFCRGAGGFYPESEGKYKDDENKDNFYSFNYLDKMKK